MYTWSCAPRDLTIMRIAPWRYVTIGRPFAAVASMTLQATGLGWTSPGQSTACGVTQAFGY